MNMVLLVIASAFLGLSLLQGYVTLRLWSEATKLRAGVGMSELCIKIRQVRSRADPMPGAEGILTSLVVVGALAATICFVVFRSGWLGTTAAAFWVTAPAIWFRAGVPPGILLLSNSSPQTISLHVQLKACLPWQRVVAMLDMKKADVDFFGRNAIMYDVFRTDQFSTGLTRSSLRPNPAASGDDWRSVMESLGEMALIIVLDMRQSTPIVVEEAQWALAGEHKSKVLCIGDQQAGGVVLPAMENKDHKDLRVLEQPQLAQVLREALRSRADYLAFLNGPRSS